MHQATAAVQNRDKDTANPDLAEQDTSKSLKEKLGPDFEILYPVIADPESPTYENWRLLLNQAIKQLTRPVILIGHSLGGSVLLKYLAEEQTNISVSALFVIAAPYWERLTGMLRNIVSLPISLNAFLTSLIFTYIIVCGILSCL